MADEPDLNPGDQGEWVTYLQQVLEFAGYAPGAVDGNFGQTTTQALTNYQQAQGLPATGAADAATWAGLTGSAAGAGAAAGASGAGAAGAAGGPGDEAAQGEADVPHELVAAGAPASFGQWSEEQKNAYFANGLSDQADGDAPAMLVAADIPADGEAGSLA